MSGPLAVGQRASSSAASVRAWLAGLLACSSWQPWASAAQAQNRPARSFIPDSSDAADKLLLERGRPCAGPAVVRGDQYLSAGHRAVRRQGREAAQGRAGRRSSGDFVLTWTTAGTATGAIAQLPPEAREIYRNRRRRPGRAWFQRGASQRDPGCSAGWSTRHFAARGVTMRSSCWETWRFRTGGSARPWRCTAGWWRTIPTIRCAGASRSVGRPGAGRRQEAAVPGGRG